MTKFLCSHHCKDIKRSKCNFCLAFCSVFTVVISTLILNTVIGFGPIIFLRISEEQVGQYDALFVPKGARYSAIDTYQNSDHYPDTTPAYFLNFT